MDWANEDYVRIYTRDTADDLVLSWQAMALWHAMLRKFDRSGLIETRHGWTGLARCVRMPDDVVIAAGQELLTDGRLVLVESGFFCPNYIDAQTTPKSDKARQRESRDRRRDRAAASQVTDSTQSSHDRSRGVTTGHAVSRAIESPQDASREVTLSLSLSDPDPKLAVAMDPDPRSKQPATGKPVRVKPTRKVRSVIPEDWKPREQELDMAKRAGLNPDVEVQRFIDHHTAKGNNMADWNAALRTWINNAVNFHNQRYDPRQHTQARPRDPRYGRIEPKPPETYGDGDVKL